MLDIQFEKNKTLSTQDRYSIIDSAVRVAEDNGFVNSFIFQHALYVFSAIMFYPEDERVIQAQENSKNLNDIWDDLIKSEVIDEMFAEHQQELDVIASEGKLWLDEFSAYTHSTKSLLDDIQTFSQDLLINSLSGLKKVVKDENVDELLKIAENWGMSNTLKEEDDSLFKPVH